MIRTTAAAFAGLSALRSRGTAIASPYGPLAPRRAENAIDVLLALPADFRYTILNREGALMDDDNRTPAMPDGMAAFAVGNELRLVCNHEIRDITLALVPGQSSYDTLGGGGTTTIVVDPLWRVPLRRFVSLSGTSTNCGGGPTPWGSWITCEETTRGQRSGYIRSHGYCFEVPAAANGVAPAVPLPHLGRFPHEAAAVDPRTSIVYLTEDQEHAGLYRCVLDRPFDLSSGGRLQMLAIRDLPAFDTAQGQRVGARLPVAWVDIPQPDPRDAESNPSAVYAQGRQRGGARFRRLEGAWFSDESLFFVSTTGGTNGIGQVWQYRARMSPLRRRRAVAAPGGGWDGDLTLLFEAQTDHMAHMPDNVTVTPRGSLLLCEDNFTANHLRGLTPEGDVFPFARNIAPGFERSELAGATFSPDGATLFVNIQAAGTTLAIWGPWERGPL